MSPTALNPPLISRKALVCRQWIQKATKSWRKAPSECCIHSVLCKFLGFRCLWCCFGLHWTRASETRDLFLRFQPLRASFRDHLRSWRRCSHLCGSAWLNRVPGCSSKTWRCPCFQFCLIRLYSLRNTLAHILETMSQKGILTWRKAHKWN